MPTLQRVLCSYLLTYCAACEGVKTEDRCKQRRVGEVAAGRACLRRMMRVRRLCSVTRLHAAYNAALASGRLRPDASQQRAVNVIAQLESSPRWPEGVYLCGEVGSGKSMVMDLMYESSSLEPRERHHFHEFMLQVHARLHAVQEARPRTVVLTESGLPVYKFGAAPEPASAASTCENEPLVPPGPSLAGKEVQEAGPQQVPPPPPPDPLSTVLDELSRGGELRLLCLDELQVTDVVDAVLLRRLFEGLFARGVRVAFTSNREPERLYERDRTVQGGRHGTRGPPWHKGPAVVQLGACRGTRGLALRSPCGR